MKSSVVLRIAAHRIMELGLAKGSYEFNGRYCAIGAIRSVNGDRSDLERTYFGPSPGKHRTLLVEFNDNLGTSAHDVASLLLSESEVIDDNE